MSPINAPAHPPSSRRPPGHDAPAERVTFTCPVVPGHPLRGTVTGALLNESAELRGRIRRAATAIATGTAPRASDVEAIRDWLASRVVPNEAYTCALRLAGVLVPDRARDVFTHPELPLRSSRPGSLADRLARAGARPSDPGPTLGVCREAVHHQLEHWLAGEPRGLLALDRIARVRAPPAPARPDPATP